LLLTGDAPPTAVAEGLARLGYSALEPVELDAFKLAHHGSRANTSDDLLSMMRCDRYLVSTNGVRFGHPDKECLARIIWATASARLGFLLNYPGTAAVAPLDDPADAAIMAIVW
jgi:beta-lactamase superfamily II metal-dependent hydrolase